MSNFDGVSRLDMVQYGVDNSIKSRNRGIQDVKSASEHERGGCVVRVLEADVVIAHYFRFDKGGELRVEIGDGEPDGIIVCGVGDWEMVRWDQEREGRGTVAKVADRITPKVEPPPCV